MAEESTTRFTVVANQKGGVGKSTVAIHLAAGVAKLGYRVCVVDADPQGTISKFLLGAVPAANGLAQMLVGGMRAADVWLPIRREAWSIALVTSDSRTGAALAYSSSTATSFADVRRAVRTLAGAVDVVILDMPPSRLAGFEQLIASVDDVVIPCELARGSVEGVDEMFSLLAELREVRGEAPRLLAIVPNKYRSRTTIEKQRLVQLVNRYQDAVWPPLPLRVAVEEAWSSGLSLFESAPGSDVAKLMADIVGRYVGV